jgi:hypothetical protein
MILHVILAIVDSKTHCGNRDHIRAKAILASGAAVIHVLSKHLIMEISQDTYNVIYIDVLKEVTLL